ncbi:hypothetical protein EYF80_044566 [Liparis tanakae]|uniref:Uncharacterized protein n=1 Tax=Liparis tanakae TaxID=230148 RepID=A0A4Z2FY37_9TELE|nr:hypothetical protein EYF80_044566 [Liparis tanakae]
MGVGLVVGMALDVYRRFQLTLHHLRDCCAPTAIQAESGTAAQETPAGEEENRLFSFMNLFCSTKISGTGE